MITQPPCRRCGCAVRIDPGHENPWGDEPPVEDFCTLCRAITAQPSRDDLRDEELRAIVIANHVIAAIDDLRWAVSDLSGQTRIIRSEMEGRKGPR